MDRAVKAALIPTGHEAQSYTCVRSLAERGVAPIVASEKDGVPAAGSRFCAEFHEVPSPRTDLLAYRDALLAIARRDDVGAVLPIRPEDGYLLSRYREAFAEATNVVAPPFETIERAHDRLELAAAAEAADVPVPETRPLGDVADWSDELVVKSRYNLVADAYVDGAGPEDADVVKDVCHLPPGRRPEPAELVATFGHEPIVQAFVPAAEEYMVAALYDRGEPLATFQHRQIRGTSYTGGGGVYRKSVDLPALDRVARRLLDELDWHGLACLEYREHPETGEFYLVELNPRLWQSLPATVRAGVDFPYYYWLQATGRADEIDPEYAVGVGSHLLHGELGYLASVLGEDSPLVPRPSVAGTVGEIATSILAEPAFDYLRLDDPGPFLRGVRNKVL